MHTEELRKSFWLQPLDSPYHCKSAVLFTLSRPRRAAVPCKFGIGPPRPRSPATPRRAAQSAACVSETRARDRAWEPPRQLRRPTDGCGGSPRSRSPGRAAEGLRQDASSARPGPPLRRQDAAVRRVGAPYWGQRPVPPATPPPRPGRGDASVPRAPAARGCLPFPPLGSWPLGSR